MKIALLNDTHCGVRNSSDIFIQHQEDFYTKIFFPYLKENNITKIIHLGDYYEHRKFINFKALNANRKHFLEVLRNRKISMTIIPGNHDVYYKNTNELNSLKELLGHYMNEVFIVDEASSHCFDGTYVGLVPWITQNNYERSMEFISKTPNDTIMGHFEFGGFDMYKGIPASSGMSTTPFARFALVLSGHYHTKSSLGNIHYLGSQMESTWSDADDPKYFHVWDTVTNTIEAIRNPLTLFRQFVYDDKKFDYSGIDYSYFDKHFVKVNVLNKTNMVMFDSFVDSITKSEAYDLKINENLYEYVESNPENIEVEETSVLLESYIDDIETSLDKDRLKSIMKNLYVEAQSREIV